MAKDNISKEGICALLDCPSRFRIEIFDEIESTNTYVKQRAAAGESDGLVVISEGQSGGRGRLGRSFFSPIGSGIYMSVLLRPSCSVDNMSLITPAAAVAASHAIEAVSHNATQIKWVNDILMDGKKVCGILCEASLHGGEIGSVVCGVGINVYRPKEGFPCEIEDIAASVFDEKSVSQGIRNAIIAEFLKRFTEYTDNLEEKSFLEYYRQRSAVVSQQIKIIKGAESTDATAVGIDDQCRLTVRYQSGEIGVIDSGEVSIRLAK